VLNPVHLHTLRVVLRTGSFAEAARRLGYTGSAVSQQIVALERQLKTTLFERDAHSIRPTPSAEYIATRSGEALGVLQALEDDIGLLLGGVVGRLRLGSFPSASELLLPSAVSAFKTEHPHVRVELDEGEPQDLVPLLQSRELDVALVYRYNLVPRPWPETMSTIRLLREDLLIVMPETHPGAAGPEVDVRDLADDTWLATNEGTSAAAMLRQLCRSLGFEPEVSYRSNNYAVIQGLVSAGLGVAIVPALGYRPAAGLAAARIADGDLHREVFVAAPLTAPAMLVDALVAALRDSAAGLAHQALGITAAG